MRRRTYCVDCSKKVFVPGEANGTCKRHNWLINMRLANADKVCSYDGLKDTFFDEDKRKADDLKAWKKNC